MLNIWALLISTAIPMVVGMIWYNPKIGFGNAWMKAAGVSPDAPKSANLPVIFTLTTIAAFFVAFAMQSIVIHQSHIAGVLMTQPDYADVTSQSATMFSDFMGKYGTSYRTFKHGFFHGFLAGVTLALPIVTTNALFEGKRGKYIFINAGYWTICMALMGGVTCAMI